MVEIWDIEASNDFSWIDESFLNAIKDASYISSDLAKSI